MSRRLGRVPRDVAKRADELARTYYPGGPGVSQAELRHHRMLARRIYVAAWTEAIDLDLKAGR